MKTRGFTLAEVLVTLVIIGVIAAMVVPSLVQRSNGEEFRSGLKKAISVTSQALVKSAALDGITAQDCEDADSLVDNIFLKKINHLTGTNVPTTFPGDECSGGRVFVANDGIIFCVSTDYESENSDDPDSLCNSKQTVPCGSYDQPQLWIDVNGVKKPNKATTSSINPKDQYSAQIYAQRVVPFGKATQGVMYGKFTETEANSN